MREDQIFSPQRVRAYGSMLLLLYAALFTGAFVVGYWVFDEAGAPRFADFLWIWTAAKFSLSADAATAYDYAVFAAAQEPFAAHNRLGFPYYHWLYPPSLFLILAPLGLLPYGAAFLAWIATTGGLYLFAIHRIVPRPTALLIAVLPFPVAANLFLGHAGFLIAGLLGLALAWLPRRPWLAGLCLGLLTIKPQFGIIFPVFLLITGQWRVILGAGVSFGALLLCTTAWYGWAAWEGFWRTLSGTNLDSFMPDAGLSATVQSFLGLLQWLGVGIGARWAAHGVLAVLVTVAVCAVWRRPVSDALKAAALAAGALALVPYMLFYDLTALSIPAAFLVRDGLTAGFVRGERLALLGCFVGLFFLAHLPVGPVILLLLGVLILRRMRAAADMARSL